MDLRRRAGEQIESEACRWWIRLLDPTPDAEDPILDFNARRAAFCAWLAQSPEHARSFRKAAKVFRLLQRVDPHCLIDLNELLADQGKVIALRGASPLPLRPYPPREAADRRHLRSPPTGHLPRGAIAAFALLVAVPMWFQYIGATIVNYATAIGEQRLVPLDDGSTVRLNTRSHVAVEMSAHARQVTLFEGEALFEVVHNDQRPFRVITDDLVIRDIGTTFDVYQKAAGTTVFVVEGAVAIWPIPSRSPPHRFTLRAPSPAGVRGQGGEFVRAGQQASMSNAGKLRVTELSNQELRRKLIWQENLLAFKGQTLSQVIAEFNRYNRRQLVIDDREISSMQLGGTFLATDPDGFADTLARTFEIRLLPSCPDSGVIRLAKPK